MLGTKLTCPLLKIALLLALAGSGQGQTLTVLHALSYAEGATPRGTLAFGSGVLYGTTSEGGTNNTGTIFKINTNGTGFTLLKHLAPPAASVVLGRLILSGDTLYGTSRIGGANGKGTVFKIKTDGTGYSTLKSFASTDGAGPYGGLTLSGTTLYGTTYNGGTWDNGTVFKINTDSTGFAVLKQFNLDGVNPGGELALAGNTLYGTTCNGGLSGSIFKIKTDGSGYTVLKTFAYADGNHPNAGVIVSGQNLYGATYAGGTGGGGTLYKMGTNGTGYAILHTFMGTDGANPYASLCLAGSSLYGTAYNGGGNVLSIGTVFKINTDGGGYTVLKDLVATEPGGTHPFAGLTLAGGMLYGATANGAAKACGAIFSLSTTPTPPTITSQPQSQTNKAGTTISFQVAASGNQPLSYQWRHDLNELSNGPQTTGVNSNVLTLANLQVGDAGDYTVVITNLAGSITSAVANLTITVDRPPIAGADEVQVPLGLQLRIPTATLLANDSDPANRMVGISAVQSPSALGTIVGLANETVTYWGGFDAPSDYFTYTLTNSAGATALGTVYVTLTGALPGTNQMIAQPLIGGSLRLIVGGHLTSPYALEQASALTSPINWQALETNWAGARGYVFFTNTPAPGRATFYRVRRLW